jgi:hypothetical protein
MKVIEKLVKVATRLFWTETSALPPLLQKKALRQESPKKKPTWLKTGDVLGT